ncbi:MAG: glycosyltransferase [Candidatus Methanomethylicus sp.]|nr:glycosyltransferase [Candidatus Methanomethylicus sp.]
MIYLPISMRIEDYAPIAGADAVESLRAEAERLKGRRVLHINSTFIGGGVAELLKAIVPMMGALGLKAEWNIITGDDEFFNATKSFHNALHGTPVTITEGMIRSYEETNRRNAKELDLSADCLFIHDPQPAMLIESRKGGFWVWRCHIDISSPTDAVWSYLSRHVRKYDAAVVHIPEYAKPDLGIPQHVIPPSIDPLSEKNIDLPKDYIESILRKYDLDPELPIITQVSRFDRLKDPVGVFKAFRQVKESVGLLDFREAFTRDRYVVDVFRTLRERSLIQLVLVGGSATDDPEGYRVYKEVLGKAISDRNVFVLMLPPDAHREINAIQRGSTILIQKSLREGFGLTVTEGMWKGKAVIGGMTGGIAHQIRDGETGFLVRSVNEAAERILYLLRNPKERERLGAAAKEHVRRNYLVTRHVRDYLRVIGDGVSANPIPN